MLCASSDCKLHAEGQVGELVRRRQQQISLPYPPTFTSLWGWMLCLKSQSVNSLENTREWRLANKSPLWQAAQAEKLLSSLENLVIYYPVVLQSSVNFSYVVSPRPITVINADFLKWRHCCSVITQWMKFRVPAGVGIAWVSSVHSSWAVRWRYNFSPLCTEPWSPGSSKENLCVM